MMRHVLVALMVVAMAGVASAGLVATDSDSVPSTTTSWADTVTLDKYGGPAVITKVVLKLDAGVAGSMGFENTSSSSGDTVTLTLAADVEVKDGPTSLLMASPADSDGDTVGVYDGTTDYAGTSGRTYSGVSGSESDMTTLTGAAMAPFLGAGTIALDVTADGASSSTGGGSVVNFFDSSAEALVTVEYYDDDDVMIPEPAGLGLVGMALMGLVRRKRS
jgi:hypothetical protein